MTHETTTPEIRVGTLVQAVTSFGGWDLDKHASFMVRTGDLGEVVQKSGEEGVWLIAFKGGRRWVDFTRHAHICVPAPGAVNPDLAESVAEPLHATLPENAPEPCTRRGCWCSTSPII